jgi:RNA polymerase sigma-70 factor (ECF subfamily)
MMKQRRKGALTRRLQADLSSHSRGKRLGIVQTVARCVAGPHEASISDDSFREQMIAFLPRLSRFALSLTGNTDQRDDLVQETCARALLHKDQWQPGTRLDSWMFRIAQNLWLDLKRADKFRGDPIDIDSVSDAIECDGQAVVESRLALAEVSRGLDRLAPEHRILIGLVCVDGMTYKQASEVLELPVGTVMSRLARARLALHEAIQGTLTPREMRRGRPFR